MAVEPKARFGINLRRLREDAGLTQMQLGLEADMDMAEISRFELGGRDPRLSTIVRLADALDQPLGTLLEGIARHPG